MPARRTGEAHRALEQLEEYHATLTRPSDDELRLAIERVIGVFKSNLFQALLGMCDIGKALSVTCRFSQTTSPFVDFVRHSFHLLLPGP